MTSSQLREAPSEFSAAEITKGLLAVAYWNGNTRKAEAFLAEGGMKVDHTTLYRWQKVSHPQEYERLRKEVLPKIGAEVADEHMGLARKQIELSNALADKLKDNIHQLEPRDVAGAMRNASVSAGIHTEKARDLAGDFETPSQERSAIEVLRALAAKGVPIPEVIEGTGEEIKD